MSKIDEIAYPERMAAILGISPDEVSRHLLGKPFNDGLRSRYFSDIAQLMGLLPPPDARILDLGVGPGWTSRFLAKYRYRVIGLDISPSMIAIARAASEKEHDPSEQDKDYLSFEVCDYEKSFDFGIFDAAVIYDALHHADDEGAVIRNVFRALKPGGIFITMEPGAGHSVATYSIEATQRFGTTEKDMEYERQRAHMLAAGFSDIKQFIRLSELPLVDITKDKGAKQNDHLSGLLTNTRDHGSSSIVVAVK
jgi:SAM-dependent methyltransferase